MFVSKVLKFYKEFFFIIRVILLGMVVSWVLVEVDMVLFLMVRFLCMLEVSFVNMVFVVLLF